MLVGMFNYGNDQTIRACVHLGVVLVPIVDILTIGEVPEKCTDKINPCSMEQLTWPEKETEAFISLDAAAELLSRSSNSDKASHLLRFLMRDVVPRLYAHETDARSHE